MLKVVHESYLFYTRTGDRDYVLRDKSLASFTGVYCTLQMTCQAVLADDCTRSSDFLAMCLNAGIPFFSGRNQRRYALAYLHFLVHGME